MLTTANDEPGLDQHAPTTGEYRVMVAHGEKSVSTWRRNAAIIAAVAAMLGILLTINAIGPCRSSWAFADAKENTTAHTGFDQRITATEATLTTLGNQVGATDTRTVLMLCLMEADSKDARKTCRRQHPVRP